MTTIEQRPRISRHGSFCETTERGTVKVIVSTTGATSPIGQECYIATLGAERSRYTKSNRFYNTIFNEIYDASIDKLEPFLQENIRQESRRHKTELHSHPDDEKAETYRSHAHFTATTLEGLEQIVKTSKAIDLTKEDISSLEKTFNAAKKVHQCAQGEDAQGEDAQGEKTKEKAEREACRTIIKFCKIFSKYIKV